MLLPDKFAGGIIGAFLAALVGAVVSGYVLPAPELPAYDALLVAVGGVQQFPYPRALAYGGPGTDERMHGLIHDIEAGYVKRVAFVVAPGVSWPLPLYELALMTAERADEMCAHVELTLVTPEASALELFGPDTARDVGNLLDTAGIIVRANTSADVPTGNLVEPRPEGERLAVDRVVTLPTLLGPRIDGLPHDAAGFIPVDAHGRVSDTPGVYAAGDATDFAIKQGGIACQQADAAAEAIAAAAARGSSRVPSRRRCGRSSSRSTTRDGCSPTPGPGRRKVRPGPRSRAASSRGTSRRSPLGCTRKEPGSSRANDT